MGGSSSFPFLGKTTGARTTRFKRDQNALQVRKGVHTDIPGAERPLTAWRRHGHCAGVPSSHILDRETQHSATAGGATSAGTHAWCGTAGLVQGCEAGDAVMITRRVGSEQPESDVRRCAKSHRPVHTSKHWWSLGRTPNQTYMPPSNAHWTSSQCFQSIYKFVRRALNHQDTCLHSYSTLIRPASFACHQSL